MTSRFHFMPGDQVAYIPTHVDGNINHHDVEFGFIVSVNHAEGTAFVRYWSADERDLRTKANSECTPLDCLVPHMCVTQLEVCDMIRKHIGEESQVIILRRLLKKECLED